MAKFYKVEDQDQVVGNLIERGADQTTIYGFNSADGSVSTTELDGFNVTGFSNPVEEITEEEFNRLLSAWTYPIDLQASQEVATKAEDVQATIAADEPQTLTCDELAQPYDPAKDEHPAENQ